MKQFLDGKKSHIVAVSLILFGVFGVISGQMTTDQAITLVLNGLGLSALRAVISKVE